MSGRVPVLMDGGVRRVLEILRDELDSAMALAGCATVGDFTSELIARSYPTGHPGEREAP